ncbi:class I SAM-dependent methyltransferase [Aeromicrobium sp. UC242_57]|uniref:class I SAM-dependent methyltransferase n=1 Tax=Aeromicrobium sp. UC242_57 TaxID=3374624 RepID=UPI00378DB41A
MPETAFRPTLRRSWKLFRAFGVEQTDPDHFYGTLARDSVAQISTYGSLDGQWTLDVGGGPGYFADAFRAAGATYTALDADLGELSGLGDPMPGTVLGSGMQLPFADDSFGVTYSSNVLEHVSAPWTMADEMVRVTRPGGLVFISYTLWFGPWGGHETAPWHFLGGHRAARRYEKKHGHPPKNVFGTSLFAVTAAAGIDWARSQDTADVVAVIPRYLPRWAWWVLRVPGLREVVTWNLAIVLRKR